MNQNNKNPLIVGDEFPPQNHFLRDLKLSFEMEGKDKATFQAPVVKHCLTEQGTMRVGVIAALVDTFGGNLSVRAQPDWIATSDLLLHTTGRITSGVVTGSGSVIRAGRTTVVIGVDIRNGSGNPGRPILSVGEATMTFSRLPRRKENIKVNTGDDSAERFTFAFEGSGLNRSFLDKMGLRVLNESEGIVELILSEYTRNSVHALQGGLTALLADVAGQHAARNATGKPFLTSDLALHYLSPGRVGPFQTKATVLRMTEETVLTRVRLIDTGADDRLVALAVNTSILDKTG